jgi:hypothetical protein
MAAPSRDRPDRARSGRRVAEPGHRLHDRARALYGWSLATLVWVHVRTVSPRLALAATGVDLVAFTALALLSGGAFSHVRLAFFVGPGDGRRSASGPR